MNMLEKYLPHNSFKIDEKSFSSRDPHLLALSALKYQYSPHWWKTLSVSTPGIYILTGGRQVGKSTSCKLFIQHCIRQMLYPSDNILYLPCDEIFDQKQLSQVIRYFLQNLKTGPFLLIIDEVTYVPMWERVIKSLADEGAFYQGICLLTGSDTLMLKEAAMSFPGRRGQSDVTDFHVYPLNFREYVGLMKNNVSPNEKELNDFFQQYLQCGGYLRAINDVAAHGKILSATFQTYEQWIRGDFLKQGKNEFYLMMLLDALISVGVSQISFSALTQKIGSMSKETCLDYYRLLERMDVVFTMQAYDQNKKQGFPKKARKFHFMDPFIRHAVMQYLSREGRIFPAVEESMLVESVVASHCHRLQRTYYFKGQGEVDIILPKVDGVLAIEIKWANQVRSSDMKTLRQFPNRLLLTKHDGSNEIDGIRAMPIPMFLYNEND